MIEFLLKHASVIDVTAKIVGIVTAFGLIFPYRQYKHSVRTAQRASDVQQLNSQQENALITDFS